MPRVLVHAVGYNDDGISAGEAPIFENFRYDRITLTGQFLEHDHSKIACEVIDIEDLTTKNTQLGMLYLMTLR
jgi:hypothetical protein